LDKDTGRVTGDADGLEDLKIKINNVLAKIDRIPLDAIGGI